jgi:hypothetical protein
MVHSNAWTSINGTRGLLKFEEAIKGVSYKFVRGHNG